MGSVMGCKSDDGHRREPILLWKDLRGAHGGGNQQGHYVFAISLYSRPCCQQVSTKYGLSDDRMRKVVLPQFRKTTLNSVIAESPTELARDSGSVDSYMLPGVVTPSAMSDDGAPDVLSASPEASADLLPDSGPHEHHVSMSHTSTAWAKLRPIKTDLVQQGKSDSVPVYTGEDALIDSPGEVASPVEFSSPLAASPEQVASPVAASPQQMNSPVMLAESPIEDSTAHTTLSPATKGLGLSISPTAVKTTPADVQISASPTEDTLVVDSPTDEHFIVDSPSGSP